jgi:hypothetical protein
VPTPPPPDSDVKRLNTEQIDKNLKKLQPDEFVLIGGYTYAIEEQTTDDANMAIRVVRLRTGAERQGNEGRGNHAVVSPNDCYIPGSR